MKRGNAKRTPKNLTDSQEQGSVRRKRQPPQHVRALARLAALAFFLVSSRPPAAAAGPPTTGMGQAEGLEPRRR